MSLRSLGLALSRLSLAAKLPAGLPSVNSLAPLHSSRTFVCHVQQSSTSRVTTTCRVSCRRPLATQISTLWTAKSVSSPSSSSSTSAAVSPLFVPQVRALSTSSSVSASLRQMHKTGPVKKKRKNKNPLVNKAFARGVVLKTLIKKPRKPNSANRKCVLVRLSTGREMVAYVPGIGHNLQEHNIVLVRPGRLQDVPGVKIRCVRGKYDLQHVIKKKK